MGETWHVQFFAPGAVVVVGVSGSPEKLGYAIARNIVASGYGGGIHFVGRSGGQVFGRTIHTSLKQIPGPIDLAVLIVPSPSMPAALEECAQNGIRAAILISGGFGELGAEGKLLEYACLQVARRHGMRLLGPNCIGILDTHLPLDTTFLQSRLPTAGGIALLSHSGAMCAAIVDWARGESFGFSRIVSLGNQIDINEADVLSALAEDEHTRVIVAYLEGVADGARFVEVARQVTQRKPVIALKAGRSAAGQKAAASHTGAMAASDAGFDAAFERAGVLRADTVEQMFDWARALQDAPLPSGRSFAVLTDAGGLGVIAADALEQRGLALARFSDDTNQALRRILPEAAPVGNPVDLLASASPEGYARCLEVLLADPGVAGAMVIVVPPPLYPGEEVADALTPVIQAAAKPVVIALTGSELARGAARRFEAAHIVAYPFPERAASALEVLTRRREALAQVAEGASVRPTGLPPKAQVRSGPDLIRAYGIPTPREAIAGNPGEAATLARQIGFPVVIKIQARDVSHKSDVGGVILNIRSEAEARAGFDSLNERLKSQRPEARLDGVLVQQQVQGGQEIIIGSVRDATFGPLIMFGSGGVETEGLRDIAFALCPLDRRGAERLLQRTWAGKRLGGFRSIAPADRDAVVDLLIHVSWLAHENPQVQEFEINPALALTSGAVAIDVRVRFSDDAAASRPAGDLEKAA